MSRHLYFILKSFNSLLTTNIYYKIKSTSSIQGYWIDLAFSYNNINNLKVCPSVVPNELYIVESKRNGKATNEVRTTLFSLSVHGASKTVWLGIYYVWTVDVLFGFKPMAVWMFDRLFYWLSPSRVQSIVVKYLSVWL